MQPLPLVLRALALPQGQEAEARQPRLLLQVALPLVEQAQGLVPAAQLVPLALGME